jgi:PAS domain S-box-containing protein
LLGAEKTDQLLNETLDTIAPPPSGHTILKRVREARERGDPFIEHELMKLDGARVAVELSAVPFIFRGRTAVQIIAHDITVRKQTERALLESEARKTAILETALDAIISIDHRGLIQEWNPAAQRIFGYTRAQALQQPVDDLIVPPSLRQVYEGGVTNYLMNGAGSLLGRAIELTLRRADGKEFRAELAISRVTEGPPSCTALIRDITDRKRVESALRQTEERFRLLVEGVKDYAIYILDPQGRVATWNTGAERLEGYRADEIIGKPLATFFTPEDIDRDVPGKMLKQAISEGHVQSEGPRLRKGGVRFWSEGVITALRDEAGMLHGFAKIAHDMTQKKKAEEEIRQLNATLEERVAERTSELQAANQELEAFSYSVSHDLRAPLRHISGYVEILQMETEASGNEELRQHLETIATSARQMGNLIDALLAFSRMGRAEMHQENVDVEQLIDDARRELNNDIKDRAIEWQIGSLPKVRGDRIMLRQVIVNLLSNALKYSRDRKPARIEIGTRSEEDKTIFYIRDNGVGFDMQYAQKLFGVFQRLHHANEFEGTGIGLANVRRIIHRHGGRVWAEGRTGEGATFFFSLLKPKAKSRKVTP